MAEKRESRNSLTKPGPIRAGFDYQDVIAAEAMLDWMESPESFRSIVLEADEAGYLDDIVVERADRSVKVTQVKFSTDPESDSDPWDWADLLSRKKLKSGEYGKSLLQKWVESWTRLSATKEVTPRILTNRRPTGELRECIPNRKVIWESVNENTKEEILEQVDKKALLRFLSVCEFHLSYQGLDEVRNSLKKRFFRLKGTENGWLRLCEAIRNWAMYRHAPGVDGGIFLSNILDAAQWRMPRALDQKFAIPDDYLPPSSEFVNVVRGRLGDDASSCVFLSGYPASGKSTFVSWLCEQFESEGQPFVRHHYFLSLSDRSGDRMSYTIAAESLVSELRSRFPEALGDVFAENPNFESLPRYLEAVGSYFQNCGGHFFLILDGLDHVWRETKSVQDLRKLLDLILPVHDGVKVLFVSQPVSNEQLPSKLLAVAPRNEWLEMPPLDLEQVEKWIEIYESDLPASYREGTPSGAYARERLGRLVRSNCEGQPLHLRYTWQYLAQRGIPVSCEEIERMPGCPEGDIREYYDNLWSSLSIQGQNCLVLLTISRWKWPEDGLIDVLIEAGESLTDARIGFAEIRHMLQTGRTGLEPFHQSLNTSTRLREEGESLRSSLLRATVLWLSKREKPDYWRWAFEWTLTAELENST